MCIGKVGKVKFGLWVRAEWVSDVAIWLVSDTFEQIEQKQNDLKRRKAKDLER